MNNVLIYKNGEQLGPFSIEQVRHEMKVGSFTENDFAWRDGFSNWVPIRMVLSPPPPPLPSSNAVTHTSPPTQQNSSSGGVVAAGLICAIISIVFLPPAFGLAALVCGIVALAKGNVGGGVGIIIMAVTCSMIGMYVGAMLMSR